MISIIKGKKYIKNLKDKIDPLNVQSLQTTMILKENMKQIKNLIFLLIILH